MKKNFVLNATVSIALSSNAFAGGVTGGSGMGKNLMDAVNNVIFSSEGPDLGIEKLEVSQDAFRRMKMRLAVADESALPLEYRILRVKNLKGAVTDIDEMIQVVPAK